MNHKKLRICQVCFSQYEIVKGQSTKLRCPVHKVSIVRISEPFEKQKDDRARKVLLIKERGHQCEVCKNFEWNEKDIPLELDHIDGNADDSRRENLRLICPNCHAQTDTYKGKNTASSSRRSRYIRNLKTMPS